jgi:Phosphotransferase enzyme family
MRVDEAFAELAHRIDPGGKMIRTWDVAGGAAQVTGFEIESGGGGRERLVLRRHGARDLAANPHVAEDEFRLLSVLGSAGIPVPALRYLDAAGELFFAPCLVVEFVEGATPTTADEQAGRRRARSNPGGDPPNRRVNRGDLVPPRPPTRRLGPSPESPGAIARRLLAGKHPLERRPAGRRDRLGGCCDRGPAR